MIEGNDLKEARKEMERKDRKEERLMKGKEREERKGKDEEVRRKRRKYIGNGTTGRYDEKKIQKKAREGKTEKGVEEKEREKTIIKRLFIYLLLLLNSDLTPAHVVPSHGLHFMLFTKF